MQRSVGIVIIGSRTPQRRRHLTAGDAKQGIEQLVHKVLLAGGISDGYETVISLTVGFHYLKANDELKD